MNVYVRELSAELGRRGVQVDVFTRSQDPCVPHVNDVALGPNARVIHVPTGPEAPMSSDEIYAYLPEFVNNVIDFAEREGIQYDVIHSHYWLSGWAAERLRDAWGGVPIIQMFHTLGRMKNRIARSEAEHESRLRIRTEQIVTRAADILIASTPAERIQLLWLYNANMHKIRVVSPGVDLEHFHPIPRGEARREIGIPESNQMLLFVGRIEPLKGIDTLLRAIALLKTEMGEAVDNLCMSIIGGNIDTDEADNAEMVRLQSLSRELGLGNFVAFLGAKSQETLQYYYSAAEAVIMPSHYESFGLVALEAMACGTPVVASEVGGLAYLVQDGVTGFHVPADDPEELAGKIRLILNNDELRREMSSAAMTYAQRYSWPRIADQIQKVYGEVLEKLPAPAPVRPGSWEYA